VFLCFGGLLQADTPGDCYHWNTGSDSSSTFADSSGEYCVSWSGHNCAYHIDTFNVHVVQPPLLFVAGNSCINATTGLAYTRNAPGDTTNFTYRWENSSGTLLKTASSPQGDSLAGLPPGDYRLRVSCAVGCDTTFFFTVDTLPMPALPYLPDTTVCRGRHLQFNSPPDVTAAYWIFGDGGTSTALNPLHPYGDVGDFYPAVVVSNAAGCSDTAFGTVHVKALELSLRGDSGVLDKGSKLVLKTYANKSYSVVQWKPFALFPDQSSKQQTIYPEVTVQVVVKAVSELGCEDTASLEVFIKPTIKMPTAFSPNGDGLNDYFKPFAWGQGYKVITFQVFNRWGQMVYHSFGDAAMKGWDGSCGGKAVDAGTYYYRIDVSTEYGESIEEKGDVTLIR
jgi:gliding motility-associated-like protein